MIDVRKACIKCSEVQALDQYFKSSLVCKTCLHRFPTKRTQRITKDMQKVQELGLIPHKHIQTEPVRVFSEKERNQFVPQNREKYASNYDYKPRLLTTEEYAELGIDMSKRVNPQDKYFKKLK